jgi:hypothetical protein
VFVSAERHETIVALKQRSDFFCMVQAKLSGRVRAEEVTDASRTDMIDIPGKVESKGSRHFHGLDVANIENPDPGCSVVICSSKLLLYLAL